jgi:hypothetical protein
MDLYALGGAYRSRTEDECIKLFWDALTEDESYAMKCLFYLRDIIGGQGERRFFRVCMKWLANYHPAIAKRNMEYIPILGRWDDLYVFVDTPLQSDAFKMIKQQLKVDLTSNHPSLLAKWLPSINASSDETRRLAKITCKYLGMTYKEYRKTLSTLRERIKVLECLMSEQRWDEIDFAAIPSKAGLKYRAAFERHDLTRDRYESFMKDSSTKVNAKALTPYECVRAAFLSPYDEVKRAVVDKYWDNLTDYFNDATFDGLAIVDTSGSMMGEPLNIAISIGLYCADKARGPYHNHFLTFSDTPELVEVKGKSFCDKVLNMSKASWSCSTDIESAMDTLLYVALTNHCRQEELPKNLIIISDMEFNWAVNFNEPTKTLFESMKKKWAQYDYQMPKIIFWNVAARNNNIPMRDDGNVNYVSGSSPVVFQQIMKGLTAKDLMFETLNSERYKDIH